MSGQAKKEWQRISPLLIKNGLLTDADIMSLSAYCQAYRRWLEAEKAVRIHGLTFETDKGNVIQRPEVGIANTAMRDMLKYAKEFGLTPASRVNLNAEVIEEQEDPFMNFIKGGKNG